VSQQKQANKRSALGLVVKYSREFEQLLKDRFNAHGHGLGERVVSIQHKLPYRLYRDLKDVAHIRNRVVHDDCDLQLGVIRSLQDFTDFCVEIQRELIEILAGENDPQNGAGSMSCPRCTDSSSADQSTSRPRPWSRRSLTKEEVEMNDSKHKHGEANSTSARKGKCADSCAPNALADDLHESRRVAITDQLVKVLESICIGICAERIDAAYELTEGNLTQSQKEWAEGMDALRRDHGSLQDSVRGQNQRIIDTTQRIEGNVTQCQRESTERLDAIRREVDGLQDTLRDRNLGIQLETLSQSLNDKMEKLASTTHATITEKLSELSDFPAVCRRLEAAEQLVEEISGALRAQHTELESIKSDHSRRSWRRWFTRVGSVVEPSRLKWASLKDRVVRGLRTVRQSVNSHISKSSKAAASAPGQSNEECRPDHQLIESDDFSQ
jgi:hypothetical protein